MQDAHDEHPPWTGRRIPMHVDGRHRWPGVPCASFSLRHTTRTCHGACRQHDDGLGSPWRCSRCVRGCNGEFLGAPVGARIAAGARAAVSAAFMTRGAAVNGRAAAPTTSSSSPPQPKALPAAGSCGPSRGLSRAENGRSEDVSGTAPAGSSAEGSIEELILAHGPTRPAVSQDEMKISKISAIDCITGNIHARARSSDGPAALCDDVRHRARSVHARSRPICCCSPRQLSRKRSRLLQPARQLPWRRQQRRPWPWRRPRQRTSGVALASRERTG